jgi:hypothetical protein
MESQSILNEGFWEDSGSTYFLELWVETEKSLEEFESSLAHVVEPLVITNHEFKLGAILCRICEPEDQPPKFPGVPLHHYSYTIQFQIVDYLIWGCIDRQFAYAVAVGLRVRFSCNYLTTKGSRGFVLFSGTNQPTYINLLYPPWEKEWKYWRTSNDIELKIDVPISAT